MFTYIHLQSTMSYPNRHLYHNPEPRNRSTLSRCKIYSTCCLNSRFVVLFWKHTPIFQVRTTIELNEQVMFTRGILDLSDVVNIILCQSMFKLNYCSLDNSSLRAHIFNLSVFHTFHLIHATLHSINV